MDEDHVGRDGWREIWMDGERPGWTETTGGSGEGRNGDHHGDGGREERVDGHHVEVDEDHVDGWTDGWMDGDHMATTDTRVHPTLVLLHWEPHWAWRRGWTLLATPPQLIPPPAAAPLANPAYRLLLATYAQPMGGLARSPPDGAKPINTDGKARGVEGGMGSPASKPPWPRPQT